MPTSQKTTRPYQQPAPRVEEIFVKKYDQMLQWALRLTRGDQELAEDLLHEAFVHFMLRQLDFTEVENIDGYLYTVLKHFHLSSMRRAKREPLNQISLVEFDSVDLALRSTFDVDQVEVQNDLRRICTFLCWRKASAKAASYLILRYFHGYYPEEITRVALTSRNVVDHGIGIASAEAKVCLSEPGRLRFLPARSRIRQQGEPPQGVPESAPIFVPVLFAVPAAEFGQALSEIIFGSRADECLPREDLLRHYERPFAVQGSKDGGKTASIDRTLLAHLVSCPQCLDAVNHHLRMPPLSDRFPGERLGNYRRTVGKGGSAVHERPKGTGSQMRNEQALRQMRLVKDDILRVAQTRLRECFEHQPEKLFIAVNGDIVATQDVTSDHNKLSVRLYYRKIVDFIEVFSEQGIRLAFISVTSVPPEGPDTLSQQISLSAGRSLEMILEFTSSGPLLEVVYSDPLLAHSVDFLPPKLDQSNQLITDPTPSIEGFPQLRGRKSRPFPVLIRERWDEWMEKFRPLAIFAALASVFVIGTTLHFAYSRHKAREASMLLSEAAEQEGGRGGTAQIIHRVMEFTVTSWDGKQTIQRGTVDVWRCTDKSRVAMRFSLQNRKLIAGIWKAADGSYSIYQHHQLINRTTAPESMLGTLFPDNPDDLWMDEPSAANFKALTAEQGAVTVEQSGGDSVIDYRPGLQTADPNRHYLMHATLTLRRDRHVVGQVFWIQTDGKVRRYSYREVSYEERKRSTSDSDADVFSPDRTLEDHTLIRHSSSSSYRIPAYPRNPDLEVNVLYSLHKIGADTNGQVEVSRGPDGVLKAYGTVDSEQSKRQIISTLSQFHSLYGIKVEIRTTQELINHPAKQDIPPGAPATLTDIVPNGPLPIDQQLREALRRNGVEERDLTSAEQEICRKILDLSDQIHAHAWVLRQMAQRFSNDQLQNMGAQAKSEWLDLTRDHAHSIHVAASGLDNVMMPLFPPHVMSSPSSPARSELSGTKNLLLESKTIVDLAAEEDRILNKTFSLENQPTQYTDPAALWPSLNALDICATNIARAAERLEAMMVPFPSDRTN